MKEAGFHVPDSFDLLPEMINKVRAESLNGRSLSCCFAPRCHCQVYTSLVEAGEIVEQHEGETPQARTGQLLWKLEWAGICLFAAGFVPYALFFSSTGLWYESV